ncbi:unnamed protein product [Sphagnum jensenii]|uniref:DUF676 domain-containing protein n=1 Tax=Sphagnum jensenii TaxID=128206 RepID=A0ABP0X8F6_9BRYO
MTTFQCIFGIFHWLCGATRGTTQVNSAGRDKNYTVNQLWPGENENVEPNSETLTLIFFHGLQLEDGTSPWRSTWTARGTDECWPQKWVPEDLREKGIENVRVLSLSYDSIASRWGRRGRTRNVSDIGKDLVQKLICNSDWKLYEHQRIVLVGHSFGGLVIKSVITEAHKRLMKRGMVPGTSTTAKGLTETMDSQCREFLKHIRHIIFYAVPHLGTNIANYVKVLNNVVSLRLAGIVDNLKPFQMEMEELSDEFECAISQELPIPIYAIVETQTYMKVIVVERASATRLANEWMTLEANHVNICKPEDKRDDGYRKVMQILEMIMEPQGDADDCCDTEYATPRSF